MPDLVEQMYCSQQIFIPPNLPSILKKYAKAAIRTQPGDLLIWSSAYFRALAAGLPPPTKERIEYPPIGTPSGLSPGFLKVLINQIGKGETVSKEVLEERWRGVCLSAQALQDLFAVGMFGDDVHWLEFLAICAGTLQPSLTKTMMQLCELLTEEPEGGSAAVPVSTFLNLYKYLAKLDCGPVNTLEQYEQTLKEDSETQCAAEVLEPQEVEVETAVPNIDWDTAIGDVITTAGISEVEDTKSTENDDETENPEQKGETPSKDGKYGTVTVDAEEIVTVDAEETVTEEPNQEFISEDVTDVAVGATEGTDNESLEVADAAAGTSKGTDNESIDVIDVAAGATEGTDNESLEVADAAAGASEGTDNEGIEVPEVAVGASEGTENEGIEVPEITAGAAEGTDNEGIEVLEVAARASEGTDNEGIDVIDVAAGATEGTDNEGTEVPEATAGASEGTDNEGIEVPEVAVGATEGTDNESLEVADAAAGTSKGTDNESIDVIDVAAGATEGTDNEGTEVPEATAGASEGTDNEGIEVPEVAVGASEGTENEGIEVPEITAGAAEGTDNEGIEVLEVAARASEGTDNEGIELSDVAAGATERTVNDGIEVTDVTTGAAEGTEGTENEGIEVPEVTAGVAEGTDNEGIEVPEVAVGASEGTDNEGIELTDVAAGATGRTDNDGIEVTNVTTGAAEVTENKDIELVESGAANIIEATSETVKPEDEALDETKDEPLAKDAEEEEADADSVGGSNGGDSGVATADESQDPKGAVKDDAVGSEQNDELTENTSGNTAKDDGPVDNPVTDKITSEQDEVVDRKTSNDVDAIPAERTYSEGGNDDGDNVAAEVVVGEDSPPEKAAENDDTNQPEESPSEPQSEIPQDPEEESTVDGNQGGETFDPELEAPGVATPTDSANENNGTTVKLPVPQSEDETDPSTVVEETPAVEPNVETAVESSDDGPVGTSEERPPCDETATDEAKADEANSEEPPKTEPMLNIGSVYIIDDDGTLSAAPRPVSANDDGDLQERDSDKSIATNASDVGMIVWPEIKPEKEEVEAEPIMEKEVTSEDGIEVLTDVDIQPVQEDIKMLPEKAEEVQPEVAGNEENIFAPQIDSFTDLLEAESAPAEEFSPEELAAVERSSELYGEESSKQIEPSASLHSLEAPTGNVTQSTEHTQQEAAEDISKNKSDHKSKKDADIESLVKKDSEMMLLPTPVTSDIMLYVDGECEKTTQKVSPTQQLANKMSLVDVQVAVPIDETVVEVVERHRYPKWMNIPGIGPIVPDHIVEEAEKYFLKVSELQEGMVMPRNIRHFHCPPLEVNPECIEDERKWSANT